MKKTLLEIYALLICLVSVICFSIWLGVGTYSLVGIFAPDITMDAYSYQKHQTNDRYWESNAPYLGELPFQEMEEASKQARPDENELTKKRLASYTEELNIETRNNKQSILRSIIVSFITALLFLLHWRLAKSARNK